MPSTAALELLVSLKDNASSGLDAIGEKGGGMGDLVKGGAIAAGGSILALGGFLVAATKAASDEQVGMDRLGQTLTNNIPGWKGNEDAVEGYVSKMENMAFADDDVRDSLNKLVPRTHDLTEAQKLQATAMDLARYKNIDLSTATDIVGKVYSGNTAVLNRYGIAVAKGTSATDALAQIQKVAGGQAQVYADSAAGGMERLQTAFGDALETVGHEILPAVTQALKGLADFISSPGFQQGFQAFADFIGGTLAGAAQAITPLIQGLGTVFGALFGDIQNGVSPLQTFEDLISNLIETFASFFGISVDFEQWDNIIIGTINGISAILQPFISAWVTFFQTITSGGDVMGALGTLFQNFGQAFANAWSIIGPALGQLLQNIFNWIGANAPGILAQLGQWAVAFGGWVLNTALPFLLQQLGALINAVWNWIVANGPGILTQLGIWAQQFGAWVWNTAIPALLQALGSLIAQLWNWITTNGPGILTQLGTWAQAFGNWVMTTALPALMQGLGSLIAALWNWIVQAAPGIYQQLQTWKDQFFNWIMTDVVPNIPTWLGNIAQALWNFISDNGPKLLTTLGQWTGKFEAWVLTDVVPKIPGWLGNIAQGLWDWITSTAKDLGSHLINEWIPAFWKWLTGPGGVKEGIGGKLNEAWTGFTTWVANMVKSIPGTLHDLGGAIISGIREGIVNAWDGFVKWITGLFNALVEAMKQAITAHSPSKLFADEIGAPIALGIGVGFANAWAGVEKDILARLQATQKQAKETAGNPAYAPGEPTYRNPAYEPGNGNPAYNPGEPAYRNPAYDPQNPAYNPGEPAYRNPAYDPQNPAYLPGGGQTGGNPAYGPNQPLAGSGGQGARAFGVGFTPIGGNAITIATLNIYAYPGMDGATFASSFIDQLEEELSASVRTRRGV